MSKFPVFSFSRLSEKHYDLLNLCWIAGSSPTHALQRTKNTSDVDAANIVIVCHRIHSLLRQLSESSDATESIPYRTISKLWYGALCIHQRQVENLLEKSLCLLIQVQPTPAFRCGIKRKKKISHSQTNIKRIRKVTTISLDECFEFEDNILRSFEEEEIQQDDIGEFSFPSNLIDKNCIVEEITAYTDDDVFQYVDDLGILREEEKEEFLCFDQEKRINKGSIASYINEIVPDTDENIKQYCEGFGISTQKELEEVRSFLPACFSTGMEKSPSADLKTDIQKKDHVAEFVESQIVPKTYEDESELSSDPECTAEPVLCQKFGDYPNCDFNNNDNMLDVPLGISPPKIKKPEEIIGNFSKMAKTRNLIVDACTQIPSRRLKALQNPDINFTQVVAKIRGPLKRRNEPKNLLSGPFRKIRATLRESTLTVPNCAPAVAETDYSILNDIFDTVVDENIITEIFPRKNKPNDRKSAHVETDMMLSPPIPVTMIENDHCTVESTSEDDPAKSLVFERLLTVWRNSPDEGVVANEFCKSAKTRIEAAQIFSQLLVLSAKNLITIHKSENDLTMNLIAIGKAAMYLI